MIVLVSFSALGEKTPESNTLQGERVILAHRFRCFHPSLAGSIISGPLARQKHQSVAGKREGSRSKTYLSSHYSSDLPLPMRHQLSGCPWSHKVINPLIKLEHWCLCHLQKPTSWQPTQWAFGRTLLVPPITMMAQNHVFCELLQSEIQLFLQWALVLSGNLYLGATCDHCY